MLMLMNTRTLWLLCVSPGKFVTHEVHQLENFAKMEASSIGYQGLPQRLNIVFKPCGLKRQNGISQVNVQLRTYWFIKANHNINITISFVSYFVISGSLLLIELKRFALFPLKIAALTRSQHDIIIECCRVEPKVLKANAEQRNDYKTLKCISIFILLFSSHTVIVLENTIFLRPANMTYRFQIWSTWELIAVLFNFVLTV